MSRARPMTLLWLELARHLEARAGMVLALAMRDGDLDALPRDVLGLRSRVIEAALGYPDSLLAHGLLLADRANRARVRAFAADRAASAPRLH